MALTQQSVLSFLIEEGGKVKKSELVRRFKGSIDCDEPEEKERNRESFKNFVNNVAVVKEIDGARFVVVRKKYEPLVESYRAQERAGGASEDVDGVRKSELERLPVQSEENGDDELKEQNNNNESADNLDQTASPIEMALQRCNYDFKPKRFMDFDVQNEKTSEKTKPYALPLRMPPTKVETHKIKADDAGFSPKFDQKLTKSAHTNVNTESPSLKRASKCTKVSSEMKENRVPSALVPLDQTEHEWLVKCASGHWSQVYGLLLRDSQLAEKKDFISGFTALHWVAKCGNSDMLVKLFEVSKLGGVDVDVNARTHGGYTPLHIAALHDQEEMMGQPKLLNKEVVKVVQCEKDEPDAFPELSKRLHSVSKLFQPNLTGNKRKSKQRPSMYSLQDEPEMEEREEGRQRLQSDVFM
ncbi:hypothetical protein WMY93_008114 [Mugilogobius chulae]|uniref:SOWAHA-C winged helix-turn-helix domain-containing protein n=1 Tax=Mugilogobius chulae TaxID=88201 RepID=A0AAW0PEZ4_9GOBI